MFQPFLHLYADPSTARPGSNLNDSALEGSTIPLLHSIFFYLIEVGCHFLFQGIFPTQGSNPCLLPWQTDSLPLSHPGSPSRVFEDPSVLVLPLHLRSVSCLSLLVLYPRRLTSVLRLLRQLASEQL